MATRPDQLQIFFITESTSTRQIHSHVTGQTHRRKRHIRSQRLSVLPSTTATIQSIRHQRRAKIDLPKPIPPLPLPTGLHQYENFFHALGNGGDFNLSLSLVEKRKTDANIWGNQDFSTNLTFGAYYMSLNQQQIGGPLLERAFRSLERTLRNNIGDPIGQFLFSLWWCHKFNLNDLAGLLSRYIYQLSSIIFGSVHPITNLARAVSYIPDNSSYVELFERALVMLYDNSVRVFGPYDTLSVRRLYIAIKAGTNYQVDLSSWDQRLFEHSKHVPSETARVHCQQLYASYLFHQGQIQEAISIGEKLHASLIQAHNMDRSAIEGAVRASVVLAGHIIAQQKLEGVTENDETYRGHLFRVIGIIKVSIEIATKYLGAKNVEMIQANDELGHYYQLYGSILESEEAFRFVHDQLEEFRLT